MGYIHYTDPELLQLLRENNRSAYNEIYNRYWKKMLLVAWNHSRNEELAKDIVQEVFITLWEKRQQQDIQGLSAFLATAVKYQVFKHYRKEQRRTALARENYTVETASQDEALLEARFLKDLIDGIVEEMPEKCRLVFHYSRNLGLNNHEIAEQTDVTRKTVENTLNRALRIIRGQLRNHGITLFAIAHFFFKK
ncbi:RNA polymerase subunit sigma-70 [Chitinophaga parva]|uniref:RNA polymerase subunit sigma-70 n=1 Tax=Chitinophaga parva TaxID=2169414 RepID=A0A2T7BGY2_9BACT|nr:sigma-70 family RNA polymerase sigma factor [Chitinophaga parva]PUZ25540.1 RNA polymerase subunit sigma-70 [Chitinophaga parva]